MTHHEERRNKVSIVKYEKKNESIAKAIHISDVFHNLKSSDKVFIKPNIVFWSRHVPMPPWGVITTTSVVEDIIIQLKDMGISEIVIGEGIITNDPKDVETPAHAFENLGYNKLAKRYGVKVYNLFERPFRKISIDDKIDLNYSVDLLDTDFIVNVPVLKTHAQTKVSLSYKNLKGCLDMNSRKKCHSDDMEKDLDYHIARLAKILPNSCAVLDGIYTLERGPAYTGKAIRSDIIIASCDMLSADIVGASVLCINPSEISYIKKACELQKISPSIDSVSLVGEPIEHIAKPHQWDFPYNAEKNLPLHMQKAGIKGISFPKFDHSLCSYCSGLVGLIQVAISGAWKGTPFDSVEILTGKMLNPTPDMNHTILFGQCQVKLNKDNKSIKNPISVPGCPPKMDKLVSGLKESGIEVDKSLFDNFEFAPALFMARYEGKPEFSQDFYKVL